LVAGSIQDLRQTSQDTAAFYLENIYQVLAEPSSSRPHPPSDVAKPPPFSPPRYAIWVNSLWFLSLVISLTCALLAILLHQWARRYASITQPPRSSPHKRARIRTFYSDGVDDMQLSWVVESLLPTLLHLTLFLFFTGLLIFLFNIDHTVFGAVAGWVGFSTAMYACVTLLPIVRHDSPYYTPLSSTAWFLYDSTRYMISRALFCFGVETNKRFDRLAGVDKAAEETAKKRSSEIDRRALQLTFDSLDEDHAREQFFDAVPGFYRSNVVKHPQLGLSFLFQFKFRRTLDEFLDRTLSSNSISESLRVNRLLICLNAAQAACGPSTASRVLDDIFDGHWPKVLLSVEIGHYLGRWSNSNNGFIAMCARSIVSCIIINAPRRDGRWLSLVMDQLGVSERVLRLYLSKAIASYLPT